MTISRAPAGPITAGPSQAEAAEAERVLAGLLPPADAARRRPCWRCGWS